MEKKDEEIGGKLLTCLDRFLTLMGIEMGGMGGIINSCKTFF